MAIIFQDDFQSYPPGPGVPAGFIVGGGAGSNFIPGVGIDGLQAWQLQNGPGGRNILGADTLTEWLAIYADLTINTNVFAQVNGDPSVFFGLQKNVLRVQQELDGTLSFYAADGFLIANSGSAGFAMQEKHWYFVQVNTTYRAIPIFGIDYLAVDLEVSITGLTALGGIKPGGVYLAGNHTAFPTVPVSSLYTGSANVNRFDISGGPYLYDAMTVEDQVPIAMYPNPGSPVIQLTQAAIELAELPDDGQDRVIQGAIEVMELPNTSKVRIIQGVIELLAKRIITVSTGGPEYIKRRVPGSS